MRADRCLCRQLAERVCCGGGSRASSRSQTERFPQALDARPCLASVSRPPHAANFSRRGCEHMGGSPDHRPPMGHRPGCSRASRKLLEYRVRSTGFLHTLCSSLPRLPLLPPHSHRVIGSAGHHRLSRALPPPRLKLRLHLARPLPLQSGVAQRRGSCSSDGDGMPHFFGVGGAFGLASLAAPRSAGGKAAAQVRCRSHHSESQRRYASSGCSACIGPMRRVGDFAKRTYSLCQK